MKTITISRTELVEVIYQNTESFGDPFKGVYTDINGHLSVSEAQPELMPILSFSGVGEFVDFDGNYPQSENYEAQAVAEYIVDERDCLYEQGFLLQENGNEVEYKFQLA